HRALAALVQPRQPQLSHGGDRLYRRAAPLGLPCRDPRGSLSPDNAGHGPAPGARIMGSEAPALNTRTQEVPLFPLGTVLFPDGALPLKIFEQRYLEMTKVCLRDGLPFGVCLI